MTMNKVSNTIIVETHFTIECFNSISSHNPDGINYATFIITGCTTDDGRYYQGGDTWNMPGCARGVCAKVLEGGWQIAVDR